MHLSPELLLIFSMWAFVLYDFHWWLPSLVGAGALFQKGVIALSLPALAVVITRGRPSHFYWPLLLYTLFHLTYLPFSTNRGVVLDGFIDMMRVAILFTASVALLDRPLRVVWLVKLFLLSFFWFGLQGLETGKVMWHPWAGNPDGYGGLMILGIGIGYATINSRSPRWRWLGYGGLTLGLLGVVSSFARGAFVAMLLVLVLLWLRSTKKMATLAVAIGATIVMIPAIELIHPEGAFWSEMGTISEGTSSGTGEERKRLWKIAFKVFCQNPLFGAGSYSTGVVASQIFEFGEIEGALSNPNRMYNKAIHNTYLQILAEQGLVGACLWLAMLFGFFRRLRRLRAPGVVAAWNRSVGGELDLYRLTVGLEAAMVGFLGCAFFYNQAYRHSFFSLVLIAFVLYRTAPRRPTHAQRMAARHGAPTAATRSLGAHPVGGHE